MRWWESLRAAEPGVGRDIDQELRPLPRQLARQGRDGVLIADLSQDLQGRRPPVRPWRSTASPAMRSGRLRSLWWSRWRLASRPIRLSCATHRSGPPCTGVRLPRRAEATVWKAEDRAARLVRLPEASTRPRMGSATGWRAGPRRARRAFIDRITSGFPATITAWVNPKARVEPLHRPAAARKPVAAPSTGRRRHRPREPVGRGRRGPAG
jgi:hypothetical protein